MARVKGGVVTRRRHKKILKLAKGYRERGVEGLGVLMRPS